MKQTEIPELLEKFEEYQLRVIDECIELDIKRLRLHAFLEKKWGDTGFNLETRQLEAMNLYDHILCERLRAFGVTNEQYKARRAEIEEE